MKQLTFICYLLIAFLALGCSDNYNFRLHCSTANTADSAFLVFVANDDFEYADEPADTVVVTDRQFSFACNLTKPCFVQLQSLTDESRSFTLIATPDEEAVVDIDERGLKVTGGSQLYSELGNFFQIYTNAADSIRVAQQQLIASDRNDTTLSKMLYDKYVACVANKDSALKHSNMYEGAVVFARLIKEQRAGVVFDSLNTQIRNGRFKAMFDTLDSHYIRAGIEYEKRQAIIAKAKETTVEGTMFVDFSAEYKGRKQSLSDFVGKGQYVLVDFWASWCMPCRMEIPRIIDIYNEYKDSGLIVLGVASWDKPKDTIKAIKELGIPYPQIINAQYEGTNVYGLNGVPHLILFGPDGTILRRGMRGEEINNVVQQYIRK